MIVYLFIVGIMILLWWIFEKKKKVHYRYGNCKNKELYTVIKGNVTCKRCLKRLS